MRETGRGGSGAGPRYGRLSRQDEAQPSFHGLTDPDAATDPDSRRSRPGKPHLDPVPGDGIRPVVFPGEPEEPAEPPRTRGLLRGRVRGGAGPQEDRFATARDQVRTDDLVNSVDVERAGSGEHRPVPSGGTAKRVARGVVTNVRLGLHDPHRAPPPARPDGEGGAQEVASDPDGRAVEEPPTGPPALPRPRTRGASPGHRAALRPRRLSPLRR